MNIFVDWINLIAMIISLAAGATLFYVLRKRKKTIDKTPIGLEDFVTLDSQGWWVVSTFAALGAVVMIVSSALIGVAYWTGLAIDGDIAGGVIDPETATLFSYLTVGVGGFFFLAIVFELFSDLGVPLASGMAGRKKPLMPQLILAATLGCIIMSLVTKWGYYDDKREFRETQLEQQVESDTQWHDAQRKAQAAIARLEGTPSVKVADARARAAEATITRLEKQIVDATTSLAGIPESHSTNRLKAQEQINGLQEKLALAEQEKIKVEEIKENRIALDEAEADLAAANAKIIELVGASDDGEVRIKAGDTAFVRVFRVAIHQFLCWLFPMLWFEGRAAYKDVKKKEQAAERRRETIRAKSETWDADYSEAAEEPEKVAIPVAEDYFDEKKEKEAAEIAAMMEDHAAGQTDEEARQSSLEAEAVANAAYDRATDKGKT